MATNACTINSRHFYNSGWSTTDTSYASTSRYAAMKFTTPTFTNGKSISLSFNLPFVRDGSGGTSSRAKSGTFYVKLYSSLPTSNFPSSSNKDVAVAWDCLAHKSGGGKHTYADMEVHTLDAAGVITTSSLASNTTYYLVFASSEFIQVGYSGYNSWWSASLTTYANASVNKPVISNHGNNTFSITAYAGVAGDNNTIKSSTLKYKCGSDAWLTAKSLTAVKNIPITCAATAASQNIQAKVEVVTQRGDNPTGTADSVNIPNYQAPYWNTGAAVSLDGSSLKNGRLTIKKNWKFTWSGAQRQNDSSQIVGYKLKLKKGSNYVSGLNYSNGVLTKSGSATEVYTGSTGTEVSFNPLDFSFAPGDTVILEVSAYSVDGTTSKTKKVSAAKSSVSQQVQNAGVVQVKINGAWKEGQVYTKVNNAWVEADTVLTRVNGTWVEST